jgi:hypothetical protein
MPGSQTLPKLLEDEIDAISGYHKSSYTQKISTKCSTFLNSGSPVTTVAL